MNRLNGLSVIETAVFNRLIALNRPNARLNILDTPCGEGLLALMLREKGMHVRGLDIESRAAACWAMHSTPRI